MLVTNQHFHSTNYTTVSHLTQLSHVNSHKLFGGGDGEKGKSFEHAHIRTIQYLENNNQILITNNINSLKNKLDKFWANKNVHKIQLEIRPNRFQNLQLSSLQLYSVYSAQCKWRNGVNNRSLTLSITLILTLTLFITLNLTPKLTIKRLCHLHCAEYRQPRHNSTTECWSQKVSVSFTVMGGK